MDQNTVRYHAVKNRLETAATYAGKTVPRLLAVSKTKPASAIRELHTLGQLAFGENYLQEALEKQAQLADLDIEWHFIGHLQSRKSREVAEHFDWLQSLDREKLVPLLARHRPPGREPLNVLIEVNIDDEDSKSGCRPQQVEALASLVAGEPRLRLRGLMTIPAHDDDPPAQRLAFQRMHTLFDELRKTHPQVDTLSMGMSGDYAEAIAAGSTMVRIGTALFGPREG